MATADYHLQVSFRVDTAGNRVALVHNTDATSPSGAHLHYLIYDLTSNVSIDSTGLAALAADYDTLATTIESET